VTLFAITQHGAWPDSLDLVAIFLFGGIIAGAVVVGHAYMVIDFRRYLRSMCRTLVVVVNYLPQIPAWAKADTPQCLVALGLRMPCNEDDVLRAYRKKVKRLHPDRGGDQRRFLQLQGDFEQALAYVREQV
jgi:hypothetical protein